MLTDILVDVQVTVKNVRMSQLNGLLGSLKGYEGHDLKSGTEPVKVVNTTGISVHDNEVKAAKKYVKLPADIDDQLVNYLVDHPGVRLKAISEHFNYSPDAIGYNLDELIDKKKIVRTREGPGRRDPVNYSLPLLKKELDQSNKVVGEISEPLKEELSKAAATVPKKEPAKEKPLIVDTSGIRSGRDKDDMIKASILAFLDKSPGVGTTEIGHHVPEQITRIRKLLIELEEDKKIEPRKVKGQFGPRTGYFPLQVKAVSS